ncbi:MAG TPA: choice-of-anchor D domain-containing protein, partial [Chthoniobacteraceae bacterium]|nr:choice-of-anchor D domain-containing protein [Chthoniobacteraceae bacterium]
NLIPSDVELQVGRIDLANMPSFTMSETELLRQYFGRDHAFRQQLGAYLGVPRRGLIDDNFGFGTGEVFAVSGWRNFGALFGSANVQALDWFTTLSTQKYLAAYGCGPGSYTSDYGIGNTANFATQASQAVFNLMFGSFNGDWDSTDNFLRAPLGGPAASLGLVNAWAGRPHWFIHPMGLGETIGYCARLSQNNVTSFPNGYEANDCERAVHIALMGDPTLRLHPVRPPGNLVAQVVAGNAVSLTWTASSDSPVEGYIVSRATSPSGPFTRLNGGVIAGTSFLDRSVTAGIYYTYMVRAVKLETTTSGSYLNPSQGIFSAPVAPAAASGPEINVVSNGQMISDDDTVSLASNGTDFGPVEVGPTVLLHAYQLRNAGNQPLTISSVQLSGANVNDFGVSALPASLAGGSISTFYVAFRASDLGARSARLTINNNDANEGVFDFPLGGTGLAPRAAISVATSSLDVTLASGGTTSSAIQISNSGAGALSYTAVSSLDTYSFRDSDAAGGPAYNWIEISTTGTQVTSWTDQDDGATSGIALGFSFPFYGSTLDAIRICTNGFFAGINIIPYGQNGPLPNTEAAINMIAPFWTDVILDSASRVFWQNVGGNFIVQYDNVGLLASPARRFTCEAILKPTGEIIFQYKALTAVSSSYTIGIQNRFGDDGLLISYGADYAHAGLAIRIRPPALETWLSLPGPTGTVAPSGSQQIPVNFNAAGLAPGDYYAVVTIRSNTADGKARTVPAHLAVTQ